MGGKLYLKTLRNLFFLINFYFNQTFQRIKTNRQGRLRIKIRKRKSDDCLICIGRVHRSPEELSMHSEQCRKVNNSKTQIR